MKRILSTSEIIGGFTEGTRECEVCATADADFEETGSRLSIELDSFVRPVDIRSKEQRFHPNWLPPKQIARESVSRGEAGELTREIFHRWAARVRESIPAPLHIV